MDNLEQELRKALARSDAPDGFEAKVLNRLADDAVEGSFWRWLAMPLAPRPRWAMAVVATVLLGADVAWQHQRTVKERQQGEEAKTQLELALRVTSTKLRTIGQRIDQINERN